MVNFEELQERIKGSGYKQKFLAEKLGISTVALRQKIRGERPLMVNEVKTLCDLLRIDDWGEASAIFFADEVAETATKE